MTQKDSCDGCGEKINCRETFRRLGNITGRHAILNVIVAFVLPIVVFISVMVITQHILAVYVKSDNFRTFLSALLALFLAAVSVIIGRALIKWLGKK